MTSYLSVDPATFIDVKEGLPKNGRGAWTREGIGFDYRPRLNPQNYPRIGTIAEKSLAHWAVAAGVAAIQHRLFSLGFMAPVPDNELGIFGRKTDAAVREFQEGNEDPATGKPLWVDGIIGMMDCRALWTPLIDKAEDQYEIPDFWLRGEVNHESAMDPGAVGYYIYYPDFRGVDNGLCQINSRVWADITWGEVYDPNFSIPWSANSLRKHFDYYQGLYPKQSTGILWEAAVCAHNNPTAGRLWARDGSPPTDSAAAYVKYVKNAKY